MPRHPSLILAACVLPLYAFACAPTPRATPAVGGPDPACLLAFLKARQNEVKSFRGLGKLSLMVRNEMQTTRVAWIGSRPGEMRVETLGLWGQPHLTLLINGSSFYLYVHGENRCFKGKATARNLSRLVSVPLRVEDLFAVLSGQVPVLPFRHAKIGRSDQEGRWCLDLYKGWGRLVERMWIAEGGRTVDGIEVFNGWGKLQYRVAFEEVREVEGVHIPERIIISKKQGPVLSLHVEEFGTEVAIPEGAYEPPLACDSNGGS